MSIARPTAASGNRPGFPLGAPLRSQRHGLHGDHSIAPWRSRAWRDSAWQRLLIISGKPGIQARNIFAGFRAWLALAKNAPGFCLFGKPVFWAFQDVTQPWPQSILFGHAGPMILRGFGGGQPRQGVSVIPEHPLRRF